MNKFYLLITLLLLSYSAQSQSPTYNIRYNFFISAELKNRLAEKKKKSTENESGSVQTISMIGNDGDLLNDIVYNRDFIRVEGKNKNAKIELIDIAKKETSLLHPTYKTFVKKTFDNAYSIVGTLSFDADDKEQKEILGYTCNKATLTFDLSGIDELDGFDPKAEIWYTKDLPRLFWRDNTDLQKIPGTMLLMTINGVGLQASVVKEVKNDPKVFEIPSDYTEQEQVYSQTETGYDSVIDATIDSAMIDNYISDSLVSFQDETTELFGVQDMEGNIVIPAAYTLLMVTGADVLIASDSNEKYGAIDLTGKVLIPFRYESLLWTAQGPVIYTENNLYGCLTREGEVLIPAQYEYINEFDGQFTAAMKDNKMGIINLKNEIVFPFTYESIIQIRNGLFIGIQDSKYYLQEFNKSNPTLSGYTYLEIGVDNDIIVAEKDNLHGYIDKNGKVLIPFKYHLASAFSDGVAYVTDEYENSFYINQKGETVNMEEE
ncbi:WG repeat-containing protein [Sphingobacterium spiritivorum]|uniref:WG repeat-containing protein n=1 Tax=Sphingobacterium spiritivorum TaxID=258 RepID=UPI003DA440B6